MNRANQDFILTHPTDPQLEPIRRVIDCSLPGPGHNPTADGPQIQDDDDLGQFRKPEKPLISTTSLENPLLNVTAQEYRTLRFV